MTKRNTQNFEHTCVSSRRFGTISRNLTESTKASEIRTPYELVRLVRILQPSPPEIGSTLNSLLLSNGAVERLAHFDKKFLSILKIRCQVDK